MQNKTIVIVIALVLTVLFFLFLPRTAMPPTVDQTLDKEVHQPSSGQ